MAPEDQPVDATRLRALARSLLSEEIVYFPIRHHSPACAWHLRELIRSCRPATVLVEGPAAFTSLIPFIVDENTRAPLAVYTYCVETLAEGDSGTGELDPGTRRHAAYYPFCDYSPELVALREGARLGSELRFIDLDYAAQCLCEQEKEDHSASLMDERHLRHSRFLRTLAEHNGCRDHDELWDHLFEAPHRRVETAGFIAQVAAYCELARHDSSVEQLERDGTAAREREMAWQVIKALREKANGGPVLVVTGGFHSAAIAMLVAEGVERQKIHVAAIKEQHASLIRYSFERLDRLNGYAAGMPAPAWYQLLWEQASASNPAGDVGSPLREAALHMLLEIAARLREKDAAEGIPTANIIAAYEHALRIASLRGRPGPTREDVLDAVRNSLKGAADIEGLPILDLARRVFAGRAMGSVPPGSGVPPLVRDFDRRARRQRLKIDESEPRRLNLDLYRHPEHRVTSRLLRGLELLQIPFALRLSGPDFVTGSGLNRLHEHWEYEYSPSTEAALVEAAVYGATLPEAVAAKFVEGLQRLEQEGKARSALVATGRLVHACVLGLHDHVALLRGWLAGALAEDAEFVSLCAATSQLLLLWESREPLEARDIDELPAFIAAAYQRACFLIQELSATPEAVLAQVVSSLKSLRELLHGARAVQFDGELFWDALRLLLEREPVPPLLVGAAHGLLFGADRIDTTGIVTRLRGELRGRANAREAVTYLRGLLGTARELCWQMPELLNALDDILSDWDEEEFLRALPELRLAFAELTPRETDRVAKAVGQRHGSESLGPLINYELSADELTAHLELNRRVREALAQNGLDSWLEEIP